MSLLSLIRDPLIIERLKPLRPPVQRKLEAPIVAPPRSRRYGLVGTAFDYLLRFELQRRTDHAISRHWVAEHAPGLLRAAADGQVELDVVLGDGPAAPILPPGGFRRAAKRAEAAVEEARFAVADYVIAEEPPAGSLSALAAHALRLARLDLVYRPGIFDTRFAEAQREDVEDLLALLAAVPFDTLLPSNRKRVLLNPVFGDASFEVDGADCDLIAGDLLIDLKVSQDPRIRGEWFDQLLGYVFLARRARRADRGFPQLRGAALYLARRAQLVRIDVTEWTGRPEFKAAEEYFFRRAAELVAGGDDEEDV